MTASKDLLCLFISLHRAGHVGHAALMNWIGSLKLWHCINGELWLGRTQLHHTIKGTGSATPPSSCSPHLPILISHLQLLHSALDLSNTFNTTVYEIACIVFWSQCRIAKLCVNIEFDKHWHTLRNVSINLQKHQMALFMVVYWHLGQKLNHKVNRYTGLVQAALAVLKGFQ